MVDIAKDLHTTVEILDRPQNSSRAHLFTDEAIQSYMQNLARSSYSIISVVILGLIVMVPEIYKSPSTDIFTSKYPASLLLLHSVLIMISMKLLNYFRVIKLTSYSLAAGRTFLMPSLLYCISGVATNSGMISLSPAMLRLTEVTVPGVTAVLSPLISRHVRHSPSTYLTVLLITLGGCVTVLRDVLYVGSWLDYGSICVLCLTHSLMYLILQKRMKQKNSCSNTLYMCSLNNLPILLVLFCYTREVNATSLAYFKVKSSAAFLSHWLILQCLVFCCRIWCIKWNSALTAVILGSSVILLTEITQPIIVVGLIIYIIGMICYLATKCSSACFSGCVQIMKVLIS